MQFQLTVVFYSMQWQFYSQLLLFRRHTESLLTASLQEYLLSHMFKASCVDFVADCYPQLSVKNAEREKQASHCTSKIHIYGREQQVFKPWSKFISSGGNKGSLLLESWSKMNGYLLGEIQLYVTSGKECTCKVVVC